jgi:TRAP-type C4-dicarboxylate transport system permease small subunit
MNYYFNVISSKLIFLEDIFTWVGRVILVLLMLGITLLIGAQIILRYVFNFVLGWPKILGVVVLVWFAFIGGGVGYL